MVAEGTEQAKAKADANNSPQQKAQSEKTYTESEVTKMRSDILSEVGQHKSQSERAMKSAQAALDKLSKYEQERIDAELETHRDDPAEIKRIRAEQKARQLEADLEKERDTRTEYENRLKSLEIEQLERNKSSVSQTVAQKFNVDADKLAALAKLTDGSEKAIEALAEAMPRRSTSFKPDSNRGVGGMLSWEEVRAAYIKDPYNSANRERYLEMQRQNSVVRK